jgi:hypothetical protein
MYVHLHHFEWITGEDRVHNAVVMIEGFDFESPTSMAAGRWSSAANLMVAGRFDGQAAVVAGANCTRSLPGTYTELYVGFAFQVRAANFGGATPGLVLSNGATKILSVGLNGAAGPGKFTIYNAAGAAIATGTTNVLVNTWYHVELHVLINGASSSVELRVNGVAGEIAATTVNLGATGINTLAILSDAGGRQWAFDDIFVLDTTGAAPSNTWLGDVRVQTIRPTSDGAHADFATSTGLAHWSLVDETTPNDDTDYVLDSTPGHIDTYGFSDIDGGATVFAVQVNFYARKDDAAARQIAPVVRHAGTDNVGATVTLGSTYQQYQQLYSQDPTGTDWTPTSVNADEFGVKTIT